MGRSSTYVHQEPSHIRGQPPTMVRTWVLGSSARGLHCLTLHNFDDILLVGRLSLLSLCYQAGTRFLKDVTVLGMHVCLRAVQASGLWLLSGCAQLPATSFPHLICSAAHCQSVRSLVWPRAVAPAAMRAMHAHILAATTDTTVKSEMPCLLQDPSNQ